MYVFIIKVLVASLIISLASWLSLKKPGLAGFIVALPLVSIISLMFSYLEHGDENKTIIFAKSIFVGVPASLLFFVPFFLAKTFGLSFIITYSLGLIFLIIGFFIHRFIIQFF